MNKSGSGLVRVHFHFQKSPSQSIPVVVPFPIQLREYKKSVLGAEGGRTRSCQAGSEPFIPVIRASRLRPFSNIYSFAFLISRRSAKATNELGEGATS